MQMGIDFAQRAAVVIALIAQQRPLLDRQLMGCGSPCPVRPEPVSGGITNANFRVEDAGQCFFVSSAATFRSTA